MKTITKTAIIIILSIIVSCSKKIKEESVYYDILLDSIENLTPQLIREFDDKLLASIEIIDSLAVIMQRRSDTAMIVLNVNSGEIIAKIGVVGHGPNDMISPDFISNHDKNNDGYLYFEDVNSKKIFKINFRSGNSYNVENHLDYPQAIFPSSNLNYSQNIFVGRKIETIGEKMFYIYYLDTDAIVEINYFPRIVNFTKNRNYYYAPNLALNADKNSIIAGMHFFDIVQLYDLSGNLKKVIHFSENSIPKVNSEQQILDLSNGYKGTNRIYSTNNYCYLKRIEVNPLFTDHGVEENVKNSIIKMDWDGNVIKSYQIKDQLVGGFCVEEETKKLYAIRHRLGDGDNLNEYYDVVCYNLE